MKKEKSGIIFVLIAGILWGTMGVFVNYFNSVGLGSVECAWLRLVVAAVLVSLYILIKDPKLFSIKARDLWCFLGSGILSLMIFTVCYFRTIILSSMSVAAVLLYTSPIFVIILSMIFFKEKLTKTKALSAILCVIGCAFVTGIVGSDTKISILALLLGISSGFAYALYSIFSRFALEKGYKSITITTYTFIFACLGLTPFIDINAVAGGISSLTGVIIMILSGLVTAVLPYLFYTQGLERIEGSKASVVAAIEPVVATILGGIIFKDNLSFVQYSGIVIVIFSIVLLNMKKR